MINITLIYIKSEVGRFIIQSFEIGITQISELEGMYLLSHFVDELKNSCYDHYTIFLPII